MLSNEIAEYVGGIGSVSKKMWQFQLWAMVTRLSTPYSDAWGAAPCMHACEIVPERLSYRLPVVICVGHTGLYCLPKAICDD